MKFCKIFFIYILIAYPITAKASEASKWLKTEIDKIQIDISYSTRPKKLEEINNLEFKLVPIEQKDIIIDLKSYGTE